MPSEVPPSQLEGGEVLPPMACHAFSLMCWTDNLFVVIFNKCIYDVFSFSYRQVVDRFYKANSKIFTDV